MQQLLIHYTAFWLIFIAISPAVKAQSNSSSLPNIVYILADDLGYGDISAFNENSKLHTENIDQLAQKGVRFTDAHTSSAVCTPTRYSILTGRYNWRSRLKSSVLSGYSKALIEPERLTVAELLQDKGYQTAFVGKWHLGWDWQFSNDPNNIDQLSSNPKVDFSQPIQHGPAEQGFTYSYGFSGSLDMPPYVYVENSQPTTIPQDSTVSTDTKGFWRKGLTGSDFNHADVLPHLTDIAVQYIDHQAQNTDPFFLYFALPAPHTPILPTTEFMGKSNTNFYGDFVLQVDDVVRQIVETLEKNGVREETMIIFTSDNGCSPRADFEELAKVDHDPSYVYRGHKADIYEGGHRVPFIVSWPSRIKKAFASDEVICTTDFMATAAQIAGTTLPDDDAEDSYSFLPILMNENYQQPLREATVHHSIEGRFAIRQGDWKLILWPGSGGWSAPTSSELSELPSLQLYNLSQDPAEETNVFQEHPEKVRQLKALLRKYVEEGRSTPGQSQQNDGPSNWAQLDWMENTTKGN
ncbi:MAG: arylsulfatase [Cyclobacteriaceae bacterium]